MRVSIIGQGYVGLPLAIAAANAGFHVVGIDQNSNKVTKLNNFISDIEGVDSEELKKIKTSENSACTEKINAVFNGLKVDDSPIIFTLITPFEPALAGIIETIYISSLNIYP